MLKPILAVRYIFPILFLPLISINIFGLLLLKNHGEQNRLISVASLAEVKPQAQTFPSQFLIPQQPNSKDPLQLLKNVGNFVKKIESYPSRDPEVIVQHVQQGGGLDCYGMAILYYTLLKQNQIPARLVILKRDLFDTYDTHTTVEVKINNQWRIIDPTFNVSFRHGQNFLDAQTIQEFIGAGTTERIEIVQYPTVNYPATLAEYYLDWRPLFDHVFIVDDAVTYSWLKLPPLRYHLGPKLYYQENLNNPHQAIQFQQILYYKFVFILPLLNIGLLIIWLTITIVNHQHKTTPTKSKSVP